ncbi:hypothetical protein EJB05_28716 [Eragrostis curvula]|uniref:Uncharacterized protein n=1 Tax=Eragrostis curvula TaxID=38414 RepID=A0A5J9UT08_9POAL|nr:hypothetical protein EJB05_28716 [Eragrostis curvula]
MAIHLFATPLFHIAKLCNACLLVAVSKDIVPGKLLKLLIDVEFASVMIWSEMHPGSLLKLPLHLDRISKKVPNLLYRADGEVELSVGGNRIGRLQHLELKIDEAPKWNPIDG